MPGVAPVAVLRTWASMTDIWTDMGATLGSMAMTVDDQVQVLIVSLVVIVAGKLRPWKFVRCVCEFQILER